MVPPDLDALRGDIEELPVEIEALLGTHEIASQDVSYKQTAGRFRADPFARRADSSASSMAAQRWMEYAPDGLAICVGEGEAIKRGRPEWCRDY